MVEGFNIPKEESLIRSVKMDEELLQLWKSLKIYKIVPLSEKFTVSENKQEGYRHYTKGKGRYPEFELYITDEAAGLLKQAGKVTAKSRFKQELAAVGRDSYGHRSLDPQVESAEVRSKRSVNSLGMEFEALIGKPIAVKGTGDLSFFDTKREDLVEQFKMMRKLDLAQKELPAYIQDAINFAKVYAVIRHKVNDDKNYQEYLIMERVVDAQNLEKPGEEGGIDPEEHPRLIDVINRGYDEKTLTSGRYPLFLLKGVLQKYGIETHDLEYRNVLFSKSQPKESRRYTIIDPYKYTFR
jgi:hypothetical protein